MGSTEISALSNPFPEDRTPFFDHNKLDNQENLYQWPPSFQHGQPVSASSFTTFYAQEVDTESLLRTADRTFPLKTETGFSPRHIEIPYENNLIATGNMPHVHVASEQFQSLNTDDIVFPTDTDRRLNNERRTSEIMLPRLERTISSSSFERTYGEAQGHRRETYQIAGVRRNSERQIHTMTSTPEEILLSQPTEEPIDYQPPWSAADSPQETHASTTSRRSSTISSQPGTPIESSTTPILQNFPSTACTNCSTTTPPLWRRDMEGAPLCNACGLYFRLHGMRRPLSLKTDVIKRRNRSSAAKAGTSVREISSRRGGRNARFAYTGESGLEGNTLLETA